MNSQIKDAIRNHPHYTEATKHVYCLERVYDRPKSTINSSGFSREDKQSALLALQDVDRYIWVDFMTSTKEPEALSGGGNEYCFIIHPITFQLLQTHIGGWRA